MVQKNQGRNKRNHVRYRDPDSSTIRFQATTKTGENRVFCALIANESYRGMACVYVGDPLEVGQSVDWLETEKIVTSCSVRRCKEIEEDVYILALELVT